MSSPLAPGATTGKRRRLSEPGHHCWASLPEDLVGLVGWRLLAAGLRPLPCRLHRLAVRRGLPARAQHHGPALPPAPLDDAPRGPLSLPRPPGFARSFLNLDTGALVRVRVPLLEDHLAIDSVDGLLLLGDQYQTGTVRLLHSFTGDIVELPPLSTLLPQLGTSLLSCPVLYRIKKLTSRVCASASFGVGVTTVMLSFDDVDSVAFATTVVATCLVECDSEILVVGYKQDAHMSRILVCKLEDLVLRRFIPIRNIGDNTLFLGERCMSVSSKVLSTVNGDNVVCAHETKGKDYLAQFHISKGTWSPAIDDCSLYGRALVVSSTISSVAALVVYGTEE